MSTILEILETAPANIASANNAVIDAEKNLRTIRAKLSALRHAYTLKFREEKNARLIEACVENEDDVQQMVLQEIAVEAKVKILKNKAERLYNEWVSARKLAGMDQNELDAIRGSTIRSPQEQ